MAAHCRKCIRARTVETSNYGRLDVRPSQKILASIVFGLILPLFIFGFRVTPWADSFRYWNVALLCASCCYLVYYYRPHVEDRSKVWTHLTNFIIAIVVVGVVALVYFLSVALIEAIIEWRSSRSA